MVFSGLHWHQNYSRSKLHLKYVEASPEMPYAEGFPTQNSFFNQQVSEDTCGLLNQVQNLQPCVK